MRAIDLNQIQKLYFNTEDIARALSISTASAKVTATRYVQRKIIVRLKRDLYILAGKLQSLTEEELFNLANIIQIPSYISLTTALSYYNISTQQQRNFVESIALKRTKSVHVGNLDFSYMLIKKELYCGFQLKNRFFIASPEKALADSIYLTALKRYNCDFDAISFEKINKKDVASFLKNANKKITTFWVKLCEKYRL